MNGFQILNMKSQKLKSGLNVSKHFHFLTCTSIQQIENDIVEIQGGLELTAVTDDLQVSVVSLQETDAGLMEDIGQPTEVDRTLDFRLSQLEVDGAVAFQTALG